MKNRLFLVLMAVILVSSQAYIPAQASAVERPVSPKWTPDKPAHTQILEGQSRNYIEIKFVEGSAFRLRADQMTAPDGQRQAAVQGVLDQFSVDEIERLFNQPENELTLQKSNLESASGKELPDLNLWYRMKVPKGADPEALIDSLNALEEVETAYPAPLPAPPPAYSLFAPSVAPLSDPTPDYTSQQGYLDPATGGIDAEYTWTLPGGTGSNVNIVDIEYSFTNTHEDLPSIPVIGGTEWSAWGDDHGTAVLGEIAGVNNGYGVTGIAYGSTVMFSSPCSDASCTVYNPAGAINTAVSNTSAGDVILIEQQYEVCGTSSYGPLEGGLQSVYDATLVATTAGRIVVAAAGNGGVDLDSTACGTTFDRSVRDSGAILVGAGAPPGWSQNDRSRLYFSSYGSRVDVQGWGNLVTTTGYGDLYTGGSEDTEYTDAFSGTSSASPIVTGAAALLSSIYQQAGHTPTPAWVRSQLTNTGSPQQDDPSYPLSQNIGPRPDLKTALAALMKTPPADFDGDGDTDISVFRPSNGYWYAYGQTATWWGLSTDRPVPGDYD
ncbi:MAG: S8 family serine peptidase, partial [Anaerolineales bacterium]|nr:S8 family serine peptidase [Anaerolineales bacterium]